MSKRWVYRRITIDAFRNALRGQRNKRLHAFAWGRLIVMWESKKAIPSTSIDVEELFHK